MGNDNKISSYKFVAEPFWVDFQGHLTMGVLGNCLLNCASFHAADHGFGIAEINDENYTWVLSRIAIEMTEMPYQYEPFEISTWVENVYRLFTDRNFSIVNKDGKTIGYARSIWAMINVVTRKPADLLKIHEGKIVNYICTPPCPIDRPSRITLSDEGEIASTHIVKYNDIDINGHVNSIRYIEHVLDLFPMDLYQKKRIRRYEIAYVAESYYGDKLDFYLSKDKTSELETYDIEIKKNGTDVVCRSKIVFE
jgi:medium-chain acyl-[acyl-carrier-protein] hydrolase